MARQHLPQPRVEVLPLTALARAAALLAAALLVVERAEGQDETPSHAGVRLQFLPPPMEGTISLGVYDSKGKLVRVLKREAAADDFTVALNGLITFWEGKNDAGEVLPGGEYSAKGFLVGEFAIESRGYLLADLVSDGFADVLKTAEGKPFVPQEKVTVSLRANPLEQDKPGKAEVYLAVDERGSYLKLSDGLPLTHVSQTSHLQWAAMARDADGKQITVFESDGAIVEEFRIKKIANMMAFDCGEFDFDPADAK